MRLDPCGRPGTLLYWEQKDVSKRNKEYNPVWVSNQTPNARHHLSWPLCLLKTGTNNLQHSEPPGGRAAPGGYTTIVFKYAGISNAGSLAASTAAGAPSPPWLVGLPLHLFVDPWVER